jgi:hypothetical protein
LKIKANDVKGKWLKQINEQKEIAELPFLNDEMKFKI